MASKKSVGVIGAGAAGICGAKHMLEEGLDVTLYEIGSNVGGMWVYQNDNGRSSAYKTLHINTARDLTNFSDYRFDPSVPPFPSHWDMARYLRDYSDHFGVTERVRFNTEIVKLGPADSYTHERPRWRLETGTGEVIEHDCVLLATGHLTKPLEVADFRDGFKGEYLHSHHYREPAQFVGKRVCVVGVGNSALDIASDLAVTSERVVLVARSSALIIPKLVFGKPFWDAVKPFYQPWVPTWLRNKVVRSLVYMVQGDMSELGFPATSKRVHATSNANIVNHIKYKRVLVENGIERIDGRRITFASGRTEEVDTLIAATGYLIDLDFLDRRVVEERENGLDLYMRIVPPDWRGLYFLAYFNSDTALNWICEGQARWLREHEMGRARLPSREEMLGEIEERKAWVRAHFKDTPRHGIEVEHLPYFADLKRTLREAQQRSGVVARDVGIAAVNKLPHRMTARGR
ncbi:MAG: flavin-containing monooxygenase [Hyphomicrobiaceae bacterium]